MENELPTTGDISLDDAVKQWLQFDKVLLVTLLGLTLVMSKITDKLTLAQWCLITST